MTYEIIFFYKRTFPFLPLVERFCIRILHSALQLETCATMEIMFTLRLRDKKCLTDATAFRFTLAHECQLQFSLNTFFLYASI
jgi:hypothetical protein